MKIGYLATGRIAESVLKERLMNQGAERVIIDYDDDHHRNDHKQVPLLMEGLMPGDSLYVRNLFDLSRNSQTVKEILQKLQDNNIMFFVDGEHIDFANPMTQLELARAFEYHDESMKAIKKEMDYIAKQRQERKANNPLSNLRQQSGMTQKAFAEYFDIPQRTVENWEGGQRGCPKYLLKLMQYKLINEGIIK